MKKQFLKSLILIVVTLATNQIFANHITAGDISYTCLGGNSYEINLSIYGECRTAKNDPYFDIIYYAESLGGKRDALTPTTFKVNFVSSEEVKFFCPAVSTICEGGTARGIRRYNYTGVVTLPKAASDWVFLFKQASRSFDITTASIGFESDFIVEAHVNTILAPCNSSPQFNDDGGAVRSAQKDQDFSKSFGGTDPNGDELRYSLSSPLTNYKDVLKYKTGFGFDKFISSSTPIQISSLGILSFRANTADQVGITDVKIEEYRNGALIGSITRNIQIMTYTSSNNFPVITNWKDSSSVTINKDTLQFCEGEFIQGQDFNILASDADKEDLLTFRFAGQYSGWFLLGDKKATLFKSFSSVDVGVHAIKLTVIDNHCPTEGSTEKIFYIKVNPKPVFDLGLDYDINCAVPKELVPAIISNVGAKLTYAWQTFIPNIFELSGFTDLGVVSTKSTFAPTRISKTKLTITNEFGCSYVDSVTSSSDLQLNSIQLEGFCFQNGKSHTTTYKGPDKNSFRNEIVSYNWTFQPGNLKGNNQNFDVLISKAGSYTITLEVEDALGCKKDISIKDNVCEKQESDFSIQGTCAEKEFLFTDLTNYNEACESITRSRSKANWIFGDGKSSEQGSGPKTQPYRYQLPGTYDVTLITQSEHFCIDTVVKQVTVFPKPNISFVQNDSMSLICKNPDTLLTVQRLLNGTGVHNYEWYKFDTAQKIYKFIKKGLDTTSIANTVGEYQVRVLDEKGCRDTTTLRIIDPTKAAFQYSPVCKPGDAMSIVDVSTSGSSIIKRDWKISTKTSTDSVLIFSSSVPNVYDLSLKIEDKNGCKDSLKSKINYLFLDKSAFFIETLKVPVCATDLVKSSSFGVQQGFDNISSSQWYIGVGDTIKTKAGAYNLKFPKVGDYTVYHKVIYNVDTNSTGFCIADTSVKLSVLPEFKIDVFYNRVCQFDSAFFNITRIAGDTSVPIVSTQWVIADAANNINDTIREKSFKYSVETSGTYIINVTATDRNGCKAYGFGSPSTSSRVSRPDISYLTKERICANELGKFAAGVIQNEKVEYISNYLLVINNDTVVQGVGNPRTFETNYQFDKTRSNRATIYLVDLKWHSSSIQYTRSDANACRASRAIEIELIDLPVLDVSMDTVCPQELVTVRNTSMVTAHSGAISEFYVKEGEKWVTYPSTQPEWMKVFPIGGNQIFEMAVKTDSGCVDTLQKKVYLHPGPKADFTLEQRFPEAYIPLNINDNSDPSYGVAGDTTSLVTSYYDFGDGITSTKFNPIHTFDSIKIYMVEHQVENSYGCRDTIIKPLDMRPYLDVPNAFSPNKDGINDQLGLIYKSIIDLQEYKIYNRWGQVIFDAKGDLDATWDGTFKGEDQEVGVYVVYVRGLGTYNAHFEFKKNLTLIR